LQITDFAEFNGSIEPSGCDVSENLVITDNVNVNEVGAYTVNYSVADFSGNETVFELTVNVIEADTEGPVITIENLPDLIGMFEPFNPTIVGDYEIMITATDQSGNATIETRVLSVIDTESPLIFLNGPYTILITDPNICGDDKIFDMNDDPWVLANDETDGDLTDQVIARYNYGEGIGCTRQGIYLVTYTVSDAAGNVTEVDRLVEIDPPDCLPPSTGVFDCNE